KKYVCPEDGCDKAYNRPALLRQHQRTHSNDRPFFCPKENCDKSFFRKAHLENHLLSHLLDSEKPYHCFVCGKGMTSLQKLKRHEAVHVKSFKCTFEGCDKAFFAWQSLRHHVEMDHEKALTCEHCNKCLPNKPSLQRHKLKHHGEASLFSCEHPGCFQSFKDDNALKNHIENCHPKLTCSECKKVCIGGEALAAHMRTHTTNRDNSPLLRCEACDSPAQFSNREDLIRHYEDFHSSAVLSHAIKIEDGTDLLTLKKIRSAQSMQTMLRDAEVKSETKHTVTQEFIPSPEKSSIISLMMNLNQKVYTCPRKNCQRNFVRFHAFQKHIKRHNAEVQKAEEFLRRLEEEEISKKLKAAEEEDRIEDESLDDDHFSDAFDSDGKEGVD
ncbi:hypothetical protein METBIDRAFT_21870, partial [Metschnikowia bicuspidata var. bicuspidata NRRL YB-4993]